MGIRVLLLLLLPATAAAAEPVVLHVMAYDPTNLKEAWDQTVELAREFESEHPGV